MEIEDPVRSQNPHLPSIDLDRLDFGQFPASQVRQCNIRQHKKKIPEERGGKNFGELTNIYLDNNNNTNTETITILYK